MYYSYVEIEYVAMSFSPARTDLALKLLSSFGFMFGTLHVGIEIRMRTSFKPKSTVGTNPHEVGA